MGCAISLKNSGSGAGEEDDEVWVCKERKRLMKSAVDRRYALAGAHCKYNQSLYAVALAIRLFVARHSSSPSPMLITFPAPLPDNHMHLHHAQSKPALVSTPAAAASAEEEEEDGGPICEHFYDDADGGVGVVGPTSGTMTSHGRQQNDFLNGWDFFNPFDNLVVNGGGSGGGWEDGRADSGGGNGGGGGGKSAVAVANVSRRESDAPLQPPPVANDGRELLEALKDVEDLFLKAYDSGLQFSKMLEFNNVGPPHSDFDEPKETSDKFIPAITWHKSTLTGSPSCRSLLSSSSRSSSTWTGMSSADLFDENGGMESGSHSSTLGRLYAWERKLYDEVKTGNEMKKICERKCSQLSNENGSNKGEIEDEVNDLYSRILVSMKISDSISKRIEKVRDEELQPQLIELLQGLMKTWKIMLESHKIQSRMMFEVKSFACPALSNDASHHLATLQLEAEIQNWRSCFLDYISATQLYMEALSEWAHRVIAPENELDDPPLVFTISRDWLIAIRNLPDKAVTYAMKRFAKDIRTLWAQQGIEQQQKMKVERLAAELRKKVVGFEKEERKTLESKSSKNSEENVRNKIEILAEKKAQLDNLRNRLEIEKAKHQECIQETHRVILVGFQTGFSSVFDSLTEFSEVCLKKFHDVAESAKIASKLQPVVVIEHQK